MTIYNGTSGNDTFDHAGVVDKLIGDAGDDTYIVDILKTSAGALLLEDTVVEVTNQGNDTLQLRALSNLAFTTMPTVTLAAYLENLDASLVDITNAINLKGNTAANIITGNDADNVIDGGTGNDTMIGGNGNDTYILDSAVDIVTESGSDNHDKIVIGYKNITLVAVNLSVASFNNIEDIAVTGTGLYNITGTNDDNILVGNTSVNTLTGNDGDDRLDGGAGADTLIGGDGDDTYVVDSLLDVVTETGIDTGDTIVFNLITGSFLLSNYTGIENMTLTGSGTQNLTGDGNDNILTGNGGANILDGGVGDDTLIGGAGNDTYLVDSLLDTVTEDVNKGTDTVRTDLSYEIGADIENLTLTGSASVDATGNNLVNILTGNSGNNIFDGKGGADKLIGGTGDDTYIVDILKTSKGALALEDTVTEVASAGSDVLQLRAVSDLGFTAIPKVILASNLENLDASLVDSDNDINLTGNGVANVIIGNDGNNIIDGGVGNDTMIGADGDDTYIFDSALDVVTELGSEGNDTVIIAYKNVTTSPVVLDVGDYSEVENLKVTGTGLYNLLGNAENNILTGNASVNTLTGGLGDDTLDGGLGADTMLGGADDDVYYVDNKNDVVTELTGEGMDDEVRSTISYTLGDYVENLTLLGTAAINATGNGLENTLTGNSGNNILDGAGGEDGMAGGKGNDTYVVDDDGDDVTELSNEGTDLVKSTITYTLVDNVENLTLTGNGNVDGTGNSLNNILTGNSGNNILDGAGGADTLSGGAGDDTYIVDILKTSKGGLALEDKVTEATSQGVDTLQLRALSNLGFTTTPAVVLAAGLDNLDATQVDGANAINLTGNTLANTITGNAANNVINGSTGNDTLIGGDGADTLIGGTGNDRFYYTSATQSTSSTMDVISDFAALDHLSFSGATDYSIISGYTYAGSVAGTVAAISGDGGVTDSMVIFSDGSSNYLFAKGDGTGTSYDGTLIKISGVFTEDSVEMDYVAEIESALGTPTGFTTLSTVSGALSGALDVDQFSFDAAGGTSFSFLFDAPTNTTGNKPYYQIDLVDSEGRIVESWDVNADRNLTGYLDDADTYQFVISSEGATPNIGTYSFHASEHTPDTLTLGVDQNGSIDDPNQVNSYTVNLDAGQSYQIDVTGDGSMDLKIRIFDETGTELKVVDDSPFTIPNVRGSLLDPHTGFVAPHAGQYTITVESGYAPSNPLKFDELIDYAGDTVDYDSISASGGSYTLNVAEYDLRTATNYDTIIGGSKWETDGGTGITTITYSFPTSAPVEVTHLSYLGASMSNYKGFSAAQKTVVENIFHYIESITNIDFVYDGTGNGQLDFGFFVGDAGAGSAYRALDGSTVPTFSVYDNNDLGTVTSGGVILEYKAGVNPATINLALNQNAITLIHEIGHALGLEHAGYYTSDSQLLVDNFPIAFDSDYFTVMSYGDPLASSISPTSYQVADILALQSIYGQNVSDVSDTIYDFNSTTQEYFKTIWDAGGNDTIDAHGQTKDCIITLQEGTTSSIGIVSIPSDVTTTIFNQVIIPGEIGDRAHNNITIAYGVTIENAIGGSGDDYISGNTADNTLTGNDGRDTILGLDGADIILGGKGADYLVGGADSDSFVFKAEDIGTGVDVIKDFVTGNGNDAIDISDLLEGFDSLTDAIADFVRVTSDGTDSKVAVDVNGGGDNFVDIALLKGITGVSEDDLYNNNNLIV